MPGRARYKLKVAKCLVITIPGAWGDLVARETRFPRVNEQRPSRVVRRGLVGLATKKAAFTFSLSRASMIRDFLESKAKVGLE